MCMHKYKTPGIVCHAIAGPNGYCRRHNHSRKDMQAKEGNQGRKWHNPIFLEKQRRWWDKRLVKLSKLENEKEKLRDTFDELHKLVGKLLHGPGNGDVLVLDKNQQGLLSLYMKAAAVQGKLQDIENRGTKMLGSQVTMERLMAMRNAMARIIFTEIDTVVLPGILQALAQDIAGKHMKHLAEGVEAPWLAEKLAVAARRPIHAFRKKLQTAIETGTILGESPDTPRPALELGDAVED